MALAKNKNRDTLAGLKAQERKTHEVWLRRGASKAGGNSGKGGGAKGFCSVRAAARRGIAVHHLTNPCAGVK